jgi:hypothetical protein
METGGSNPAQRGGKDHGKEIEARELTEGSHVILRRMTHGNDSGLLSHNRGWQALCMSHPIGHTLHLKFSVPLFL